MKNGSPIDVTSSAFNAKDTDDISYEKSIELRFAYLEQIRDYIYKDVIMADTKAGFALTIVAASLAAYAALFDKISQNKSALLIYIFIFGIAGLVAGAFSVLCAMLTILPRSYISHEMAEDPDHWIHMRLGWKEGLTRRIKDGYNVLLENFWQKQTKGTPQSLQLLMKSGQSLDAVNNVMHASMTRAFLVQNLKYLWAGKSLLFAFTTFIMVAIAIFLGIRSFSPVADGLKNAPSISEFLCT